MWSILVGSMQVLIPQLAFDMLTHHSLESSIKSLSESITLRMIYAVVFSFMVPNNPQKSVIHCDKRLIPLSEVGIQYWDNLFHQDVYDATYLLI